MFLPSEISVQISLHHLQQSLFSHLLDYSHPNIHKMVSHYGFNIYISLIANDLNIFFTCLLAICVPPLDKFLSKSLSHFKIWLSKDCYC